MAAEDIPQTTNAFWGGLFGVLGPKLSMNAEDARKRKDLQANLYQQAITSGQLAPEQIQYALDQIGKIYNDPNSKKIINKLSTGVGQHIQSQGQQQPGQTAPGQGAPSAGTGPSPAAGGASPGGTMMAQAALPPPVALQQPTGGGGQAPPSQVTGGGPLPPPQMPAAPQPTAAQTLQPPAGLTSGGVLASGFPNPFTRADTVAQRDAELARETYRQESHTQTTEKIALVKAERADREDFAKNVLHMKEGTNAFNRFVGQGTFPNQGMYNLKDGLAKRPGSDTLEPILWDPRNPGVMYSKKTGEAMPEGTEPEEKPKKLWTMSPDGKIVSMLADPKTNKPIPGSENPNELPPGYLIPHIHKSEFTFADENGNVFRVPTTSTTTPILPGPKPASTANGVSTTGTSAPSTTPSASRPGASSLVTPGSATNVGTPTGKITATGPGGARLIGKNRNPQQPIIDRAEVAMQSGVNVMRDLDTLPTQHPDWFGPVSGRITDIQRKIGTAPPEVSDLLAEVHAVENFLPSLHSLKGKYPLEAWGKILGDPLVNPAATKNAIRGALKAVEEYRKILITRGSNPNLSVEQMLKEAGPSTRAPASTFVRDSSGRIVPAPAPAQ